MLSSLKIRKKARCRHYHVSGRRCGSPESDRALHFCMYHLNHMGDNCSGCKGMKESLVPPKGW